MLTQLPEPIVKIEFPHYRGLPPAPVDPDSLDALMDSAGTPDDLQGLLGDTVSRSHEQPRAAASSRRVTWAAAVSSPIGYGAHAASSQTHNHQAPDWFDEEVSARMYDCQHGWVCFEGGCDTTLTPICDRAQCVAEARAEYQQHLDELAAGSSSSSNETRTRPTLAEHWQAASTRWEDAAGQQTPEDFITTGRTNGKLRVSKPGDVRITRPHAAGNPFTRLLACTSSNCRNPITHSGLCDACTEAVCDGYTQLADE